MDKVGTSYAERAIATGYGAYLALPLLRKAVEADPEEQMTREQAQELLERCMKVLFYRDARTINKVCY